MDLICKPCLAAPLFTNALEDRPTNRNRKVVIRINRCQVYRERQRTQDSRHGIEEENRVAGLAAVTGVRRRGAGTGQAAGPRESAESLEIDPHKYSQLISDKGTKQHI